MNRKRREILNFTIQIKTKQTKITFEGRVFRYTFRLVIIRMSNYYKYFICERAWSSVLFYFTMVFELGVVRGKVCDVRGVGSIGVDK